MINSYSATLSSREGKVLPQSAAALVAFLSGGWVVNAGSSVIKLCVYMLLVTLVAYCLFSRTRARITNAELIRTAIIVTTLLVLGLLTSTAISATPALLLKVFVALVLIAIFRGLQCSFIEAIAVLIYRSCFISVPLFLLSRIFPGILFEVPSGLMAIKDDYSFSYLTVFGINYHMLSSILGADTSLRNQFWFWEAGVYAFFLNLSIYWTINTHGFGRRLFILLIAILTTMSVGGGLVALLTIFSNILKRRGLGQGSITFFVAAITAVVIIFFDQLSFFFDFFTQSVFDRSVGDDASFTSRYYHSAVPLIASLSSPIFGFGYQNAEVYQDLLYNLSSLKESIISNSISQMIYYFGYPFSLLYLALLYSSIKRNRLGGDFFILIIFGIVNEPLYLSPILFMLLIWDGLRTSGENAVPTPRLSGYLINSAR